MEILDAINLRHSTRDYLTDTPSKAIIESLLTAATRARPLDLPETLYEKLADPDFHIFYRAPALIVISAATQGPWIEADGALAAENLMLAAQGQGLGSCWSGLSQPFLATPEGRALAQLPQNETPVAPLVVGRPAQTGAPTPRQPVVARWIF